MGGFEAALRSGKRRLASFIVRLRQLDGLRVASLQGALAHGFGTELWTLKRVRLLIQFHFNWKQVSAIAGLMRTNCKRPANSS